MIMDKKWSTKLSRRTVLKGAAAAAAAPTMFSINHTWSKDFLKLEENPKVTPAKAAAQFRFAIGPIPMAAEIGFAGSVGLKYGVQAAPLQAVAYATPYISTDAYAQLAVDIGIAR